MTVFISKISSVGIYHYVAYIIRKNVQKLHCVSVLQDPAPFGAGLPHLAALVLESLSITEAKII